MTGVGGGLLMTPLLIFLFGVHPATAVGTDLLDAAVTKSCSTFVHGYVHNINWRDTAAAADRVSGTQFRVTPSFLRR